MRTRSIILSGGVGPVEIRRGRSGVVSITAAEVNDAHFGLGFCHAQDRGLQLLLTRILGRGQASEHLRASGDLLRLDHFFCALGLGRDFPAQEAALTPRARQATEAYCRGVNEYFAHHRIPWELRLFGYRIEKDPWTVADIFLTGKILGYIALAQIQGLMERFLVECVQNGVPRPQLEELFPNQLAGLDEALVRQVKLQDHLVPPSLKWPAALPAAMTSNNWALAGTKTASGQPLLCNDPHLEVNRVPPIFYEAVLRWHAGGQPRYAMGGTVPGIPAILIGRTNDLAWANTYALMDGVDSWIEDCRDGRYRRGGDWLPFSVRKEIIRRKRQPPLELLFYENEHGVLQGDPHVPGYYLATRWSGRDGTAAESLDAICGILEARDVEEGRQLLGRVNNSSWNWVLAGRAGNIGYQMSGNMPRRRAGVSGLVPLPGWDPANDWQGFASPEELPRTLNPPEGFVVTANDDLNALGRVHPINLPIAPYRAERIRQVLSLPRRFTLDDMKELQLDLFSVQAARFMEIIRPLLPRMEKSYPEPARILAAWDLRYTLDSPGALLFERVYRALLELVFGDDRRAGFGSAVLRHLLDETGLFVAFFGNLDQVLLAEKSAWFGPRSREEIYLEALTRAFQSPVMKYREVRRVRFKHLLFGGKLPRFLGFDRGPFALPGGRATINQIQIYRTGGRDTALAACLRFVTDLGADAMHTALPGGPSDRRFSRWYASGIADWLAGRYKVLHGLAEE